MAKNKSVYGVLTKGPLERTVCGRECEHASDLPAIKPIGVIRGPNPFAMHPARLGARARKRRHQLLVAAAPTAILRRPRALTAKE